MKQYNVAFSEDASKFTVGFDGGPSTSAEIPTEVGGRAGVEVNYDGVKLECIYIGNMQPCILLGVVAEEGTSVDVQFMLNVPSRVVMATANTEDGEYNEPVEECVVAGNLEVTKKITL